MYLIVDLIIMSQDHRKGKRSAQPSIQPKLSQDQQERSTTPAPNRNIQSKPSSHTMTDRSPSQLKFHQKIVHWFDGKNRPRIHVFLHVPSGFNLSLVDDLGVDEGSCDLEFKYKWEGTILNQNNQGKTIFSHKSFLEDHYTENHGANKAIRKSISSITSSSDKSVVSHVKVPLLTQGSMFMITPEEVSGHDPINVIEIPLRKAARKDMKVFLMVDLVEKESYERVEGDDLREALASAAMDSGGDADY